MTNIFHLNLEARHLYMISLSSLTTLQRHIKLKTVTAEKQHFSRYFCPLCTELLTGLYITSNKTHQNTSDNFQKFVILNLYSTKRAFCPRPAINNAKSISNMMNNWNSIAVPFCNIKKTTLIYYRTHACGNSCGMGSAFCGIHDLLCLCSTR